MSTKRRYLRKVAVLLVGVHVAVACGPEPPDLAQQVTDEVNGQRVRSTDIAKPVCGSGRVTDDYGFEVEVETCGQSQADWRSLESLLEDIPDSTVRSAAGLAHEAALITKLVCHDLDKWQEQLELATQSVSTLTMVVGSSAELQAWTGSPAAEALVVKLRDALIGQQHCVAGAASGEVTDGLLRTMGAAVSAYDDLALTLRGPQAPQIAGDYWYHFDQVGHLREIERLRLEDDPVEVLFLGSSAAKRAFDANMVTEELGMSAMNAGVPAMFMGLVDSWWGTLLDEGVRADVVVVGYMPVLDFGYCGPNRRSRMDEGFSLRSRAFATIPAFSDIPRSRLLTVGYSNHALALDNYRRLRTVRGTPESNSTLNQLRLGEMLPELTEQLMGNQPCESRLEGFQRLLASVGESGATSLVVALPIHPALEGRDTIDDRVEEYERIARLHGVQHLDLTRMLLGDKFLDVTHANANGRERITSAVIQTLEAWGSEG